MHSKYEYPLVNLLFMDQVVMSMWYRIEKVAAGFIAPLPYLEFTEEDALEWREKTRELGHGVYAFLEVVDRKIAECDRPEEYILKARRALHTGLTSSDLMDTDTALKMLMFTQHMVWKVDKLLSVPFLSSRELVVARTHGVPAGVTTIHNRMAAKAPDGLDNIEGLKFFGMLSGAVGRRYVTTWTEEEQILDELELDFLENTTQIVDRSNWAPVFDKWMQWIEYCEAICTDIRLMWAFGEVYSESNAEVGSSAMPHKKNPIKAEQICGLARLARGLRSVLKESQVSWLDRDLSGSSVERVCIQDLMHLTGYIVAETEKFLRSIQINPMGPVPVETLSELLLIAAWHFWPLPRVESHALLRKVLGRKVEGADLAERVVKAFNKKTGGKVKTEEFREAVEKYLPEITEITWRQGEN